MVYIYMLELENNKYYIGKTNKSNFTLDNDFNSNSNEWTKRYKPIKILEIKKSDFKNNVNKITKKYMDIFGINNVRSDSFNSIVMDKLIINNLHNINDNNSCSTSSSENELSSDEEEFISEY